MPYVVIKSDQDSTHVDGVVEGAAERLCSFESGEGSVSLWRTDGDSRALAVSWSSHDDDTYATDFGHVSAARRHVDVEIERMFKHLQMEA